MKISILIAARNEEAGIEDCLWALIGQNTSETYEILIGNDRSTDRTAMIVQSFIKRFSGIRYFLISEDKNALCAKANVLAQLAQEARGEILFITDADTCVPATWLTEMLAGLSSQTAIRTGITLPQGTGLFAELQRADWMMVLGSNYLLSSCGFPILAMGNNMLVRKTAYQSVGGYEEIPFSVTEDFALFRAVRAEGWRADARLSAGVLAITRSEKSWKALERQRLRWMRGVFQVGGTGLWLGLLASLQVVLLVLFLSFQPTSFLLKVLILWSTAWSGLLFWFFQKVNQPYPLLAGLFYPMYALATYSYFLFRYVMGSRKTQWRGREI